ncbi:MAG: cell division protein ZapA [Coprobacter sp.]|nr:cell division protein ZapA [Coprobacter sp.]
MDDKQPKQRITVTIANRSYSFYIERDKLEEQEPFARGAADVVNERFEKYQKLMSCSKQTDMQDIISVVAWEIAYDYLALSASKDADILAEKLRRINSELERHLQDTDESRG